MKITTWHVSWAAAFCVRKTTFACSARIECPFCHKNFHFYHQHTRRIVTSWLKTQQTHNFFCASSSNNSCLWFWTLLYLQGGRRGGPHRDRCVLVNLLTRRKVREFCRRIRTTVVNELDCTTIKSQNLYEGRLIMGPEIKDMCSSIQATHEHNQETENLDYVCVRLLNKLPFKPWSWWSTQWSPLSMVQCKTLRTCSSNVEGGEWRRREGKRKFQY
jgi:hypothetical protein